MSMRYYEEVEHKEHMLYAKEIARTLGIYSVNDKIHSTLVKKICEKYRKELNKNKLYYCTKNGLAQVYDKEIIIKVINCLDNSKIYKDAIRIINLDGMQYKFKFKAPLQ